MENITLGQIFATLSILATFITTVGILLNHVKKWLKSALREEFDTLSKRLDSLEQQNNKLELSSDKNYLVHYLSCVEQGLPIDEIEEERFYETYERYHSLGGNSYIDHKVKKLKEEGKM